MIYWKVQLYGQIIDIVASVAKSGRIDGLIEFAYYIEIMK